MKSKREHPSPDALFSYRYFLKADYPEIQRSWLFTLKGGYEITKVIAIALANQKGDVGNTTMVVSL
ncbi:hypothetical protein [Paenibacillus radicis (ex Gao et al. 2016)]|uniref:hypothetical protein n=1 Tax=Paenibacillus radicis (ex Gao et al. 2016) TaxID=1737354 RepID=UPI00166C0DA3|nr:hypothetical protein [Paenibacillus radicis (ex Gao et al. 2016)]